MVHPSRASLARTAARRRRRRQAASRRWRTWSFVWRDGGDFAGETAARYSTHYGGSVKTAKKPQCARPAATSSSRVHDPRARSNGFIPRCARASCSRLPAGLMLGALLACALSTAALLTGRLMSGALVSGALSRTLRASRARATLDLHAPAALPLLLRQRYRHLQDAVLVARVNLVLVHTVGKRNAARERAVAAFAAIETLLPILVRVSPLARDREHAVLDIDLNVVG